MDVKGNGQEKKAPTALAEGKVRRTMSLEFVDWIANKFNEVVLMLISLAFSLGI